MITPSLTVSESAGTASRVAAALKSKAGHIGFVGGVETDLIKKFEAGYVAGAKATKPDVKVDVKYIQESDLKGFGDPAGGQEAATAEFDNGADVVYHAAGGSVDQHLLPRRLLTQATEVLQGDEPGGRDGGRPADRG